MSLFKEKMGLGSLPPPKKKETRALWQMLVSWRANQKNENVSQHQPLEKWWQLLKSQLYRYTVWAGQTARSSFIWDANSSQPCPWSYLLGCSRSSASQNEWPSPLACTPLPPAAAAVPPSSSSEPPPPSHHPPTREDSTGLLKNKFQDA